MYLVYSITRGGWMTRSGQYSSDHEQAAQFDRQRAIDTCLIHRHHDGLGSIPVALADVKEIMQ